MDEVALSYHEIGLVYRDIEDWNQAKTNFIKAIEIFEKVLQSTIEEDNLYIAQCCHDLASVVIFEQEGNVNLNSAIPLYERALTIKMKKQGRLNADTANTYFALGQLLRAYKTPHERALGMLYLEETLQIRRELYDEETDHPDVVASLFELSSFYVEEEMWKQARPLYETLISIKQEEYSHSDSEELAILYRDASLVLLRNNKINLSRGYLVSSMTIFNNMFGSECSDMATCHILLGEIFEMEGKFNKARVEYDTALKIRLQLYGDAHIFVAECLESIGHLRVKMEKYDKALEAYNKALLVRRNWCNNESTDLSMVFTQFDIAKVMFAQEQYEDACATSLDTLDFMRELNSHQPYVIADVLFLLCKIYIELNDLKSAKIHIDECINIRREWLGEYHIDTADAYKLVSKLYLLLEDPSSAIHLLTSYIKIHNKLNHNLDSMRVANAFVDMGMIYMNMKQYNDALTLFTIAYDISIRLNGLTNNSDAAKLIICCASCYRYLNYRETARKKFELSIALLRNIATEVDDPKADEHSDVSDALMSLADMYYEDAKYEDSYVLCKEALHIRQRVHGSVNEDYILSLYLFAKIQDKLHRYEDALVNGNNTLKFKLTFLELGDPVVIDTYRFIAQLLRKLGRLDEAIEHNNTAISLLVKKKSALDLEVMDCYAFNAGIFKIQSQFLEAERLYRIVVGRYTEVQTVGHPLTLSYMLSLCGVLQILCKYSECEILYVNLCGYYKQIYSADSIEIAGVLNATGVFYSEIGKYTLSLKYLEEAYELRVKYLSKNHVDIASSLNNIASVYDQLSRYEDARLKYMQSLRYRCENYGKKHPSVAQSLNNLGGVYSSMGKHEEAEALYLEALKIYYACYGTHASHPNIAATLNNLGICYQNQNKFVIAKEKFELSLSIRRNVYGMNHRSVAQSMTNLAILLFKDDEINASQELLSTVLHINTICCGSDSVTVAETYNNMGNIYLGSGQYQSAIEVYTKAVKIMTQIVGSDHPCTLNSSGNLGIAMRVSGQNVEGKKLITNAVESLTAKKYPNSHPWMVKFTEQLESSSESGSSASLHAILPTNYSSLIAASHPGDSDGSEILDEEMGMIETKSQEMDLTLGSIYNNSDNMMDLSLGAGSKNMLFGYSERKSGENTFSRSDSMSSYQSVKVRPGMKVNLSLDKSIIGAGRRSSKPVLVPLPTDMSMTPMSTILKVRTTDCNDYENEGDYERDFGIPKEAISVYSGTTAPIKSLTNSPIRKPNYPSANINGLVKNEAKTSSIVLGGNDSDNDDIVGVDLNDIMFESNHSDSNIGSDDSSSNNDLDLERGSAFVALREANTVKINDRSTKGNSSGHITADIKPKGGSFRR
jgi:tetratricopeptide (TPR) repeat protein